MLNDSLTLFLDNRLLLSPPSPSVSLCVARFCDVCTDAEEGPLPDTVWNGKGQYFTYTFCLPSFYLLLKYQTV